MTMAVVRMGAFWSEYAGASGGSGKVIGLSLAWLWGLPRFRGAGFSEVGAFPQPHAVFHLGNLGESGKARASRFDSPIKEEPARVERAELAKLSPCASSSPAAPDSLVPMRLFASSTRGMTWSWWTTSSAGIKARFNPLPLAEGPAFASRKGRFATGSFSAMSSPANAPTR